MNSIGRCGMFVNDGAQKQLLKDERRRFIEKEWPKIVEKIDRLRLDAADLLGKAGKARKKGENND